MARRRFFVPLVTNGSAQLTGGEAHHLTRVLRVKAGQRYEISDGSKVYLAEVSDVRKDAVAFAVVEALAAAPAVVTVSLLMALIKFEHFELVIEKATELGVADITPIITERTEAGLEKAVPKRLERWQRVAVEASQQSRRDAVPRLCPALPLRTALQNTLPQQRYWLDEEAGGCGLLQAFPATRKESDSMAILIGPEGGWTAVERAAAVEHNWTRVSLGRQILRAETAAIAALSIAMAAWLPRDNEGT